MKVKLKVWRQKHADTPGEFRLYETPDLNPNMSFLEMLDVVNEALTLQGEEPIEAVTLLRGVVDVIGGRFDHFDR